MRYYAFSKYYASLEKYAHKSNREFNMMFIEFGDEDVPEIRQILSQCLTDDEKEEYIKNGIVAYGDKTGLFYITPGDLRKDDRVCVSYKELINIYKRQCVQEKEYLKTDKQVKKGLSKNKSEKIHGFVTGSSFKRYVFKYEKFNMAFRLKKSRSKHQPIVVYFHGGGNGGNNCRALNEFRLPSLRLLKKDCTIIIPQTTKTSSLSEYLAGIKELIEIVAEKVDADKKRIYIFGGSAGGRCVWQMAYEYPEFLACAMSLSGELYEVNNNRDIDFSGMKNLPMWVIHSSDDCILPIENDDYCVKKLQEIGSPVKYTRYEKYGHGLKIVYNFYLKENWADWMFDQSTEKR